MNVKHEVDPIALKALLETALQLKNINLTINLTIKPESLEKLEGIVKGTIFWKGDK